MGQHYEKHLWGANTEIVSNPVDCSDADLGSSHSANLQFKKITCSGDVKISADHSATLIINELECKNLTIEVSYSSTLRIDQLRCAGMVTISVIYSSLLDVKGGAVDTTTGVINYSSTGRFYASIKTDGVVAKNSSTWLT